jgi:hypothetical protein
MGVTLNCKFFQLVVTVEIRGRSLNLLLFIHFLHNRYMVTPSTIPLKRAAALGARLVRRLMAEEKKLFLTNPLTWKD